MMLRPNGVTMLAPLFLSAAACSPQAEAPPKISIADAWARPTAASDGSTAVYFTVANKGGTDRLLSAKASPGLSATLHETRVANGISQMRELTDGVVIPAGGKIILEPGGRHLMINRIGPLEPGNQIKVTLGFERAGQINVTVPVENREVSHHAH